MKYTISKEDVFIPSFNKNKELSDVEQIRVRYRTPTMAVKNRCRRRPEVKAISSGTGSVNSMEITIERDDVTTLKEMLISISNCSYEGDDNKEIKIQSAQNLMDAPLVFEPLFKEIVKEFDRILDESTLDEKN